MRLVPIFLLETTKQTNNKCLPKFVQIENASFSIEWQSRVLGKQNSLFPVGPVFECFVIPPNSKIENGKRN